MRGEDVGARVAAVRARVAEHDDGRARVQVVLDLRRGTRSRRARSRCSRRCRRRRRRVPIASLTGLEVALALEDVGDLADALDEDERAHLAERVVQGVQDGEEEDARARDRRRHVAQHVDLRPPRADRLVLQDDRHAAGLQRGAHRPAHVDVRVALAAAALLALRLQAALELRDDAVHGGEVLQRARTAARGRARSAAAPAAATRCARSARARARGAAAPRSGGSRRGAGRRAAGRPCGRSGWGSARRPSARRMRWTSTPMTPEPSPWRPKAAIASRARSRIWPSSPSRSAAAICWRSVSRLSSAPAASIPPPSRDALADGGELGGAEEEAVEDEVEDAPVLLGLGERRGERLAEVLGLGPRHLAQDLERVEQLARPDRDALAAQLLAELEQVRGEAGRGVLRRGRAVERGPTAGRRTRHGRGASCRRARRRRRGRCGA